jgi:hypothetical protein
MIKEHKRKSARDIARRFTVFVFGKPQHRHRRQEFPGSRTIHACESESKIEAPGLYFVFERVVSACTNRDMNVRSVLGEGRESTGHDVLEEILWQTQADGWRCHRCTQRHGCLIMHGYDPTRVTEESVACFRWHQSATAPVEQGMTCLLFEALQLHTDS